MIFTADIEDWQQSVFDFDAPISDRVVRNTQQLLAILDEKAITGTFFIQGMVAEKFPDLIKQIHANGHEVACHAYTHRPLFTLSPQQFYQEMQQSIPLLEDITGEKVIGFRAPTFSVREPMLDWYCETLHAFGLVYESSIMPARLNVGLNVRADYGFADDRMVSCIEQRGIDSYPMTTGLLGNKVIPAMGGGHFRLYPYWFTRWLTRHIDPVSSVFYMHPHELDTQEYQTLSRSHAISLKTRLHQFSGRRSVAGKLERLFKDYVFRSFKDAYYNNTTIEQVNDVYERSRPSTGQESVTKVDIFARPVIGNG